MLRGSDVKKRELHPIGQKLLAALAPVVEHKVACGEFATFDTADFAHPGLVILPPPPPSGAALALTSPAAPSAASSSSSSSSSMCSAAASELGPIPVSLPLMAAQAEQIKARCTRAPFGRGEQTLYDPAVRDTWQLSPDQIIIENPAFQSSVWDVTQMDF